MRKPPQWPQYLDTLKGSPKVPDENYPKIIQILIAPEDQKWQGKMFGLADNGMVYFGAEGNRWELFMKGVRG